MFQITHNGRFVYSLIKVTKLTKPFFKDETLVRDLMFLWANQTAIPYLNEMFQEEVRKLMQ